ITTWNVEGIKNQYTQGDIDFLNSDIICLQETWSDKEVKFPSKFLKYESKQSHAITSASGRAKGGLITMFNARLFDCIRSESNEHFVITVLKHKPSALKLLIINYYIDPNAYQ